MTTLLAIIKTVLPVAVVTSFVSGLVAVWQYATTDQGIAIGAAAIAVFAAAVTSALLWPGRRDHGHDDPEAHMAPLRQPGPAERALAADLLRRGMILRPGGLSPRRAAVLARKVVSRTARTRIARTPRPAGRHAAPGKPLGISGSVKAAGRHPGHGGRPAPLPVMAVAGGGLELAPAPPLPPLPASTEEASPALHDATGPVPLPALDAAAGAGPAFTDWETGQFAAVCGVDLDGERASDAA